VTEHFYRRNLPHWEMGSATYFVTMCLAGSAPAAGCLSLWRSERPPHLDQRAGDCPLAPAGRKFVTYDTLLDASPKVRWFEDTRLASIARDALHWGDECRYDLIAYVVMPNHVHWVFTPLASWKAQGGRHRLAITAAFKAHTALACNRLLNRRGRFWQAESYDRVVRNADELARIVRYVEHNPVRAGLCARAEEWEFSSAAWRAGSAGHRPAAT
jgi:putative transposase